MSQVSTYLNFAGSTEEAFNFYKQVFGTEFIGEISRYGEMPAEEGQPETPDDKKDLVINVQLPILGGHVLMGTDDTRGNLTPGNNVHIQLQPDSKEETDKLFDALSEGGTVTMPLQTMFWGDYWGSLTDKFGIRWMFNCAATA